MDYKYLLLTKESRMGIVTINRPEAFNALNDTVSCELVDMFTQIENDPEIGVVILTGTNKSFISGADILEMKDKNSVEAANFLVMARKARDIIYSLSKPVIAAINGFTFGGGLEVALCCDLRIASENARFGLPEINLGIIPGGGGIQRLTRLVGMTRAKEMVYTGDVYDARAAYEIGFLNRVVSQDKLLDEAKSLAQKLLSKSSITLAYAKKAFNSGADMNLPSGMDLDESLFAMCFSSADQKEGMNAFTEKRKPEFKNR